MAYGVYEGTLRALIHLFKYEHVAPTAVPLGKLLANSVQTLRDLPSDITVVPVPLHPSKQQERSFNQTALLAQTAVRTLRQLDSSRRWKLEIDVLRRQKMTGTQSGLTRRQRRLNLKGAFTVAKPEQIQERDVLLLDDIYTTGATARECTQTLLRAGARRVYVATLARSQREGVAMWHTASFTAIEHASLAGTQPSSFHPLEEAHVHG